MSSQQVQLHSRVVERLNRIKRKRQWSYTQVIEWLLERSDVINSGHGLIPK